MLNNDDPPVPPAGITLPRPWWYSRGPPLTDEEIETGISAPTTEERHPFPPSPPALLHTTPKWNAKSRMPIRSASVRSASAAVSAHRPSQTSQSPRRSRSPQRTWRPSLRALSPQRAESAHGAPGGEVRRAVSASGLQRAATSAERRTAGLTPAAMRTMHTAHQRNFFARQSGSDLEEVVTPPCLANKVDFDP